MTTDRDHGMTIRRLEPEEARRIVAEYFQLIEQQGIEVAVDYLQREILRVTVIRPMVRDLEGTFRELAVGLGLRWSMIVPCAAGGGVVGRS